MCLAVLGGRGTPLCPHISELSPRMHVLWFDGHWVHHRDFRERLPLNFSLGSRLSIIQQGSGSWEQLGEGTAIIQYEVWWAQERVTVQIRYHLADDKVGTSMDRTGEECFDFYIFRNAKDEDKRFSSCVFKIWPLLPFSAVIHNVSIQTDRYIRWWVFTQDDMTLISHMIAADMSSSRSPILPRSLSSNQSWFHHRCQLPWWLADFTRHRLIANALCGQKYCDTQ